MPKAETAQELAELRKYQEERLRRLRDESYRYYEPTGVGEKFIDMVGSGENFITLYSAANGVGKTATCVNILAHMFFPVGNKYFQAPMFTDFPFLKKGRIISNHTNIEKNIIPEIKKWFPKGKYKTSKNNRPFESMWKMPGGWEFDVMTYDQDIEEFESVTLGWVWFDEPPPEAIFKAMVSRLRKGGLIFIGATPLAGSAYLYDAFAKGKISVEVQTSEGGALMKYDRKVAYIEAGIESACRTHGVRGHLRHEDILAMVAEYSEDEKQARIYGKFQHLTGLIFKMYTPRIHVIPAFDINLRDYAVREYLDPHPRNPDAVGWYATDRKNRHFVIDELFYRGTTDEIASKIKNKASQYRVVERRADPSAFNVNQHDDDGKSLADRLADRGLHYLPASKKRTASDKRIGDALSYIEVGGDVVKAPEIYIFDHCKRHQFELEHYRWQENLGKAADRKDPPGKPVDKDDHMIENLGRFLIQEPRFMPMPEKTYEQPKSDDPYDR